MSLFAEALRHLIDDTNLFARHEWAKFCGVSPEKLRDWLRDQALPTPHNLMMIQICLEHSDHPGINREPLRGFKVMAQIPARRVSPFGAQMLPTVQQYMERGQFDELSSILAKRSPEERGKLLEILYPEQVAS